MTINVWFNSLGWWDQEKAFKDFVAYRNEDTAENYHKAVESAIAIIRVVYSTHKLKSLRPGDEEDLISNAAMTITKALPRMRVKPVEKLDNDKKYMRYLFTCVLNAFYREFDALYGRMGKVYKKLHEREIVHDIQPSRIKQVVVGMILEKLPQQLLDEAKHLVRFSGKNRSVCNYILSQQIAEREVAKSVIQLLGCMSKKNFFVDYCTYTLQQAFLNLQRDLLWTEDFIEADLSAGEIEKNEE